MPYEAKPMINPPVVTRPISPRSVRLFLGLVGALLLRVQRTWRQELANVFGIVRLLVGLEYRRPGEGLPAEAAPERSLARVHPAVVLHVVAQLEGLAAELALEGAVARVHRQMGDQAAHVREALAAELAEDDAAGARLAQVHVHRGRLVGGVGGWHAAAEERRRRLQLLAVLEGLEAVGEDVAGELALMGERATAVHARVEAGGVLPFQLLQPNNTDINFLPKRGKSRGSFVPSTRS
jgi:hypothetical protein